MDKSQQLTTLLKRLNTGEDPERVRAEAREFLSSIDAKDIAIAEQHLIDEGLQPEDMQKLCQVHMELLADQAEKMKAELPPGHVVSTLISEHDMILQFLDMLDDVNHAIQNMTEYDPNAESFAKLKHIAVHLAEAELHHQREEEILFPEMESRGVHGPPAIMRDEHTQLRKQKQQLKELAEGVPQMEFADFKNRLNQTTAFTVPSLRDHIFKENNILYPTALQVVDDPKVWQKLKEECDKIGYCCFTPEQ